MNVIFVDAASTSQQVFSRDNAIYPNLGLLTIMSSLNTFKHPEAVLGFLDGAVYGNPFIASYIEKNFQSISVICFSVLTVNYAESIKLANFSRKLNPKIITIFGNEHFSSLYKSIMKKQPNVCYGFYGNDVVEGFTNFTIDVMAGKMKPFSSYPGLVYRDELGEVIKNSENPDEYNRIPLVSYSLADSLFPHNKYYLKGQEKKCSFTGGKGLKSQLVDIGRGCVKLAGRKINNIPVNACDFCAIVPGDNVISLKTANRAWDNLKNAYDQGYNYFYITAEELPMTLWRLLKNMAKTIPQWYKALPHLQRPKMYGYARMEAFNSSPEKIDTIIDILGFNHFFVGLDGLSDISLKLMNKNFAGNKKYDLGKNMEALKNISNRGCLITAGLVITHLGITPGIMEANYRNLDKLLFRYPGIFTTINFGPLCPIPGSLSFQYLINPELAKTKAEKHDLSVDFSYLKSIQHKYVGQDTFNMGELEKDFIIGCCPEISVEYVEKYLKRISMLLKKHSIMVDG